MQVTRPPPIWRPLFWCLNDAIQDYRPQKASQNGPPGEWDGGPGGGSGRGLPEAWLVAEHLFFLFKLESMARKRVMRGDPAGARGSPGGARASPEIWAWLPSMNNQKPDPRSPRPEHPTTKEQDHDGNWITLSRKARWRIPTYTSTHAPM